ncbi:ABC transporter permease [Gordonia sp. zg691]|uniref:ABC transporter permease n=1 Tax=Gordonia jinghuaiqii TaxID=2758710 RepID=A0A7D7LXX5_9ACTN|nr:ABC transporter permease [Gordonia jinghuaiqii]MBD0861956.1 ABC transporter permease [Gordonia jinghuaiqii]MCR5977861.1 ABC transporter permease [Gordonia jinghuaiqii]QMT02518.1 ABC transporter permease [Gordonia jinghuaiqii]
MSTDVLRQLWGRWSVTLPAVGIFAVVYGILLAVSPQEGTSYSFGNFMALVAPLALAAAGTTLVLLTGGFDLSVAGVISLTNVICATQMAGASSPWMIVALVLAVGMIAGAINGFLVVFLGLQSLAVSLAVHIVVTGLALVVLPAPGGTIPLDFTSFVQKSVGGTVPMALIVMLVVALAWLVFRNTRTGVAVVALGGDREATRLSGVPVRAAEFSAWVLAGLLYGMAGAMLAGTTATGNPAAGTPFQLTAFAAMALGLISFKGGRGSVIAAMFGAATLMAIPKVLFGLGVADFWVGACQGIVIILALAIPLAGRFLTTRRRPAAESGSDDARPYGAQVDGSESGSATVESVSSASVSGDPALAGAATRKEVRS